jgi:hypothetical protein
LILLATVLSASSIAGTFAPDNPGFGSSTGVVPRHASMVEGTIGIGGTLGLSPLLQAPSLTGRIGLKPDNIELRIATPTLIVPFDGPLASTPLTAGVKWAGGGKSAVGWSLVPIVAVPLPGNGDPLAILAGSLEGNVSYDDDSGDWGLWGTANGGAGRDGGWAGGSVGAWYNPDGVGLYAQTGHQGGFLVGGGGWWAVAENLQSHLGVDVWPDVPATVGVQAGVSVQR